jgi:hypothetical protein
LDEKGAAMTRAFLLLVLWLVAVTAHAHVGSPDLFYNGDIGPYPARVTIRMPRVIPGRAEISVRLETSHPVEVSFLPLYARTEIKNAPPPDVGLPVAGEANLYSGELWLMSFGAYSVEVRVKGHHGDGSVQIPLTSVATAQLPMPPLLGNILVVLACILVVGAIGIAFAAAREASLAPGQIIGRREGRKGLIAAATTIVILTGALYGGWHWWKLEEGAFREHLREGAWPDLAAEVKVVEGAKVLRLTLGKEGARAYVIPPLIPDHGKLMHLFLIRQGSRDAFAHVHPVRKSGRTFEVGLPSLPEGRYTIFCDLTFEGGMSSTATATVDLPAVAGTDETNADDSSKADPDDSWATYSPDAVPKADDPTPVFRLAEGTTVTWKAQKPIRVRKDASLRFEVRDASGKPLALEPYMGMLSHAAVWRSDGTIFAHLHPTGNYSMAAQSFFAAKAAREGKVGGPGPSTGMQDHNMHHGHAGHSGPVESSIYLPYEFPEAGDYRIWVQFKNAGRILTAAFDARVEP